MKLKFKITNDEIKALLGVSSPDFPKYSTQIINLANQNAQGTRPKMVGQMSELIKEFSGQTMEEWEKWYLERYPDAIERATEKIVGMVENFREVLPEIDRELVKKWVWDLVIVKTFVGLRFQEAILKKVAGILGKPYRLARPHEEAEGIDIGILFYKKVKDGIVIDMEAFPALQ